MIGLGSVLMLKAAVQVIETHNKGPCTMKHPEVLRQWEALVLKSADAWDEAAKGAKTYSDIVRNHGHPKHGDEVLRLLGMLDVEQGLDPGIRRALHHFSGVADNVEVRIAESLPSFTTRTPVSC